MTEDTQLQIEGQVEHPRQFSYDELREFDAASQVSDLSQLGAKRGGNAIRFDSLLNVVGVKPDATHVGLHGTRDNFHASIPLAPVRDTALIIYQLNGEALDVAAGGPFRFFIPDHAACHTDEIDECANVKFLDRIELTVGKGFDNRPQDDDEHAKLHQSE